MGFGQLCARIVLYSSEELPGLCSGVEKVSVVLRYFVRWAANGIYPVNTCPLCASKDHYMGNAYHYSLIPTLLTQLPPSNQTSSSAVADESFQSLILEVRNHPPG